MTSRHGDLPSAEQSDPAAPEPETTTTRRLSPLRVVLATVIVAAVVFGGGLGVRWWNGQKAPADTPWFAPYVDVTATPAYDFQNTDTTGEAKASDAVLSFIVASPSDACTPSWGGAYTLDTAASSLNLDNRIARVQQLGGSVAVAFGGQANTELAVSCTDPVRLEDAYTQVVDRYHVGLVDFDLEGESLSDGAAAHRRALAVAAVQHAQAKAGHPLQVWLTLPVAVQGMPAEAVEAVSAMLGAGVDVTGVNLMTMDYGGSAKPGMSMATASEDALTAAHRQLGSLYEKAHDGQNSAVLWAKLGATVMIGQNDTTGEVFTLGDATRFNVWARDHRLARLSMWSANRDRACGPNYPDTRIVSDSCSGVTQHAGAFAAALSKGFAGQQNLGGKDLTTATASPKTTQAPDDPATSPYPVWNTDGSYPAGAKVVWHHNIYQAKWWTQGSLPDDPVVGGGETPWELIGPVLPGQKPASQPTLPAGTYPTWSPSADYKAGSRVLLNGVPYEAKWWTTAQSPAAAAEDPAGSPWAPLTQAQIDAVHSSPAPTPSQPGSSRH